MPHSSDTQMLSMMNHTGFNTLNMLLNESRKVIETESLLKKRSETENNANVTEPLL